MGGLSEFHSRVVPVLAGARSRLGRLRIVRCFRSGLRHRLRPRASVRRQCEHDLARGVSPGEDPTAPSDPGHLLCYQTSFTKRTPKFTRQFGLFTANPFGNEHLDALKFEGLCLPSTVTPPA